MITQVSTMPVKTRATAIYIEDDEDWRADVQEYIYQESGLEFRDFVWGASVEEAFEKVKTVSGPYVILIDLRLGEVKASFGGYHWLLEDWRNFAQVNMDTVVFVISGQLNEGIVETLVRRGIPANHIIDKGNWVEQKEGFVRALRESVMNMDSSSNENLLRGNSGNNIDAFLMHIMRMTQAERQRDASEGMSNLNESIRVPMVVQAETKDWDNSAIEDLEVLGHIDEIFSCIGTERSLTLLAKDPKVVRVEASRGATIPETFVSKPFVRADIVHNHYSEKGDAALIGIIDSGVDVLHTAFRDSSGEQTRIVSVWNQKDPSGPPPKGFSRGTEYTKQQIDAYIKSGKVPSGLSVNDNDHGTHVASIAAGRGTDNFAGGIAPEAKLAFVITDSDFEPFRPRSLGYSNSHLLALQYLRSIAEREQLPIAINVSQGMNAGAHDGTSSLEKGFDGITQNGKGSGIAVVKSAGNEKNQRGHARLQIPSYGADELKWESHLPPRRLDAIELWFGASDNFRLRIRNPSGDQSEWISNVKSLVTGTFPSGNAYEMSYTKYDRDNGDNRLLIFITAAFASAIEVGLWSLEIESILVRNSGNIDVWLERYEPRSVAFVDHLSNDVTLSIPATAQYVISVGAVRPSTPPRPSEFSSFGPTRDGRTKPDISAPGELINAAQSNSQSGVVAMSGTSMAAPHVTGAIALLFSRWAKKQNQIAQWQQYNAAQLISALRTSTQNPSGAWNPGFGYGILDVEAFLRVLDCL